MTLSFFCILFLSSFLPRLAGVYLAKRSTQVAWIPYSVFGKLGLYVLSTLAGISCFGVLAKESALNLFFGIAIGVVIVSQIYLKNALLSFSLGFATYLVLALFS